MEKIFGLGGGQFVNAGWHGGIDGMENGDAASVGYTALAVATTGGLDDRIKRPKAR